MLRNLRRRGLGLFLAVGFGVVAYFASGHSIGRAIFGGIAFAVLISLWLQVRKRL